MFDTSVIVNELRTGKHRVRMAAVRGLVRASAVVLSELWRGATNVRARRVVEALQRMYPILTPTPNNWIESGRLLAAMHTREGFAAEKLRQLHSDVLIALTARNHGARLITSNRGDFEVIRRYVDFELELW